MSVQSIQERGVGEQACWQRGQLVAGKIQLTKLAQSPQRICIDVLDAVLAQRPV